MIDLRQALEEESWQPADIPYSYLTFFNLFFDPTHNMNEEDVNQTQAANEVLQSSRPSYRGMLSTQITSELNDNDSDGLDDESISPEKGVLDEEGKSSRKENGKNQAIQNEASVVKILKNELYIEDKRYRLTSSVLMLIKIIYDYLHLAQKFKGISMECILKIIEIIKVHLFLRIITDEHQFN